MCIILFFKSFQAGKKVMKLFTCKLTLCIKYLPDNPAVDKASFRINKLVVCLTPPESLQLHSPLLLLSLSHSQLFSSSADANYRFSTSLFSQLNRE